MILLSLLAQAAYQKRAILYYKEKHDSARLALAQERADFYKEKAEGAP